MLKNDSVRSPGTAVSANGWCDEMGREAWLILLENIPDEEFVFIVDYHC